MFAMSHLSTVARADVTEPDNVIYGAITLGATPVTAAQTDVVIEARKTTNGSVVSSYRMGENPAFGDAYSLEIPLEAFVPLANTNGTPATWVSSQRENNGASFTFSLRGVPASRYAIEFTTNLVTWSILQTNHTDAGGNYLLRVTNSPPAAY